MLSWSQELTERRISGAAHMFTLHLGVSDRFVHKGKLVEIKIVLPALAPFSSSAFFATFNRGTGIRFTSQTMETQFFVFLATLHPQTLPGKDTNLAVAEFLAKRRDVDYMFSLFSEMLEIAWIDDDTSILAAFKKAFPSDFEKRKKSGAPFFCVVLEYEASISPHGSLTCSCAPDRNAIVTLLTWGVNQTIADAYNTVLLVTEHLHNVAEELAVETNGIIPIEIPFLTRQDREETIAILEEKNEGIFGDLSPTDVARVSAGMSRRAMTNMVSLASYRGVKVSEHEIFSVKKKHLEEQGQGMITIQKPIWGLPAIGGLDDKKDILKWVAQAMTKGDRSAVPQGIGFFGGPGLGKTVCVQALAHMTNLEVITLRNLMSMWVGESERNTDYIHKKIASYGPAIAVIDEFDTAFQKRGAVFHGDSGVSARVMQRFLEVMSDTDQRGNILWIMISNRPQDIDDAFLRPGRMDLVVPFLPPDTEERVPILGALLHKFAKQTEASGEMFRYEVDINSFARSFAEHCHGHHDGQRWSPCDPDTHHRGNDTSVQGLTGAEMECIVTNAIRAAKREGMPLLERHLTDAARCFKPTRDMVTFNRATFAALKYCNDVRYVPVAWREKAWKIHDGYIDDTSTMQLSMQPTTKTVIDTSTGGYL